MTGLRPGERGILKALMEGPKTFTQLRKETTLYPTALSPYLKRLQKIHLVKRDIDTRQYRLQKISLEIMFFHDVLDFMQGRIEKLINQGKSKAGIIYGFPTGWQILTESVGLEEYFRRMAENARGPFAKLGDALGRSWKNYVLSTYNEKEEKLIKTYEQYLLDIVRMQQLSPSKEMQKKTALARYEALLPLARHRVLKLFPKVNEPRILAYMTYKETKREFAKLTEALSNFDVAEAQPWDLEDLYRKLTTMEHNKEYRKDLTEEETKQLNNMGEYLENSRNKKVFSEYRKRLIKIPKSLVLYTSHGFKGYIEEMEELFPEVAQQIKDSQRESRKLALEAINKLFQKNTLK